MITTPLLTSGSSPSSRNFILSPSALTFLFQECPRCFYLDVARGMKRPSTPMPRIFNDIDAAMKSCYLNQRTDALPLGLPSGTFAYADEWVQSKPIAIPGRGATITFRGRFDTAMLFDGGTAGLCDFKTSSPRGQNISLYARQLHAYAACLENPAPGKFSLPDINILGLIVFQPQRFKQRAEQTQGVAAYFGGGLTWISIPRDDVAFMRFLAAVADILDQPTPPPSAPECPYCKYLATSNNMPH